MQRFCKKLKNLSIMLFAVVIIVTFSACSCSSAKVDASNNSKSACLSNSSNSQDSLDSSESSADSNIRTSSQSSSKSISNSQSSLKSESSLKSATSSQSSSKSDNNERLIFDKIENFLKTARDAGDAENYVAEANKSTAEYADVPDFYLNLDNPSSNDVFASPSGNAGASGTLQSPFDLATALKRLQKGRTLYLLGGTYTIPSRINFYTNGTRDDYLKIYAYQGNKVVFDFSSMPLHTDNRGMALYSNYVRIYGIDFKGAGDNGLMVVGSYNIIENCCFYDNRDTGLQILGNGTDFALWPHDNLILNCTAFNNADVDENDMTATGENADGFGCKLANGNNNTFDGCIAYANIDDGWDLFSSGQANGRTIIVNSIAFDNGQMLNRYRTNNSDGNGFKLGYNGFECNNLIKNCYAFDNYDNGFTCNGNIGAMEFVNCTAYNNSLKGDGLAFNFNLGRAEYDCSKKKINGVLSLSSGTTNDKLTGTIKNSLVCVYNDGYYFIENAENVKKSAIVANGVKKSFNLQSMIESNSSIISDENIHKTLRNSDLTINLGNYLKLKSDSAISSMGENGTALGANLNQNSYYSVDKTIQLINDIGTPKYSSKSFSLIYKSAKAFYNLTENERSQINNLQKLVEAIDFYQAAK